MKLLIAYASASGSTSQIAQCIAETMGKQEHITAEAKSVKEVKATEQYDAIILGSAIRMGRPLKEMVTFASKRATVLQTKKVAIFAVCMAPQNDNPESQKDASTYLEPIKQFVKPVSEKLFAGKIDPQKLKLFPRLVLKAVKAPTGDFRDWDGIKTWAKELSVILQEV
ncbi:flavodoxin domain-containing protein [Chitinispirillales bacterium ANBcel5]|uniref:flavodoxin domain-containing protein n=1 Tax=Cellulosispirillum alkaliphilum TaxID=3039283 RepID=UPI002A5602F0|nr:flavodoxin domain-containing protein [Chitinispirillales bacterium ANBcel5]